MAVCKECVHNNICNIKQKYNHPKYALQHIEKYCKHFKDRSQFVDLKHAEWVEDEDMYGDPIYRCSVCNERFVLEEGTPTDNGYSYCPNCGAKMDEQALKEREKND